MIMRVYCSHCVEYSYAISGHTHADAISYDRECLRCRIREVPGKLKIWRGDTHG